MNSKNKFYRYISDSTTLNENSYDKSILYDRMSFASRRLSVKYSVKHKLALSVSTYCAWKPYMYRLKFIGKCTKTLFYKSKTVFNNIL